MSQTNVTNIIMYYTCKLVTRFIIIIIIIIIIILTYAKRRAVTLATKMFCFPEQQVTDIHISIMVMIVI